MSFQVRENLSQATALHQEAKLGNINFDCLPVSLRALGATNIHILDLIYDESRKPTSIENVLGRNGLAINWIMKMLPKTKPDHLEHLLDRSSDILFKQRQASKQLAGYLLLETYPWEDDRPFHFMAILPRDHMPRDTRKNLKQNNSYLVVDTGSGGEVEVSAAQLATHSDEVLAAGGQVSLLQIMKI